MKKIKYVGMLLLALMLSMQVVDAQNTQENTRRPKRMSMEKLLEMRSSHIAHELGLDDNTASKFTDVYKKYMQELSDLRKAFRPEIKKDDEKVKKERKAPTDAEVDKMMKDRFSISRKTLDIREKYYNEFRKFLSPKQVQKIFDQDEKNKGKFHKEQSRRAGMNQSNNNRHRSPR